MIVTLLKGEANNVLSLLEFQVSIQIILTDLPWKNESAEILNFSPQSSS